MYEGVGKILGFTTHLLSLALVTCFCFLFLYFTDYCLFTLVTSHHQPTMKGWIFDVLIVLVLLYFGFNIFFNYFMTLLTEPGTSVNNDSSALLEVIL